MTSLHLVEKDIQLDSHISYHQDESVLKFLDIANDMATAKIAMQGGHVMTWQPREEAEPVLWLSEHARYMHGRSIRGGVPICWPWFGAHPTDSTLCPHGFARVMPWDLMESTTLENGATRLVMQILHTPVAQKQLSYPYTLTLTVDVGNTLKMALSTTNRGNQPFMIGEAFHTYFNVSDVAQISLQGLEGSEYSDKVLNYDRDTQHDAVRFDGEFDRVYVNTQEDCVIDDPGYQRRIRIRKSGSNSTVVWTPWEEKAHQLGDMGNDDSWRHMICIESANALENMVMVRPGKTHTLSIEYAIEMR